MPWRCAARPIGLGSDGPISPVPFDEFREAHREDVRKRRALGISAPGEVDDVYTFIPDLNTPRRFRAIAVLLSGAATVTRIGKILGGNFARVMGEGVGLSGRPRAGARRRTATPRAGKSIAGQAGRERDAIRPIMVISSSFL